MLYHINLQYMKSFISLSLIGLLIVSSSSSCSLLQKEDITSLQGSWTVEEAQRDGVSTSLLDGANFEITQGGEFNGQLMTMITEKDKNPCVLKENKIEFTESPGFAFEILEKTTERLQLKFNVKESAFEMKLKKNK